LRLRLRLRKSEVESWRWEVCGWRIEDGRRLRLRVEAMDRLRWRGA
jgi:hypothetical protein